MPQSECLETIQASPTDKYDYIFIEMEKVKNNLDIIYNPKNTHPFWKEKTININSDWKNNCISFDYDEDIVSVNLQEFSTRYGDSIDKEITSILVEQFEKLIVKTEKNNITTIKEKREYKYMWKPLEQWETDLYEYIERTCF